MVMVRTNIWSGSRANANRSSAYPLIRFWRTMFCTGHRPDELSGLKYTATVYPASAAVTWIVISTPTAGSEEFNCAELMIGACCADCGKARWCCRQQRPCGDEQDGGDGLLKTRYGLEIRAATSADASDLCEMLRVDGHRIASRAMAEQLDAIRQQPGAALIAAEWGPPIGLVLLHWYRTLEASQPMAQITTLLVVPDERRRGIGRLLVKAAAQAARVAGCGTLELLAAPDERALQAFCRSTGFIEVGPRFARPLRKKGL